MRKIILAIIAFACALWAQDGQVFAQAPMGPKLKQAISQSPSPDKFRVLIRFHSSIDLQSMSSEFRANHTSANERLKTVSRLLHREATATSLIMEANLRSANIKLNELQKFWITNAWVANANLDALVFLANHPMVEYLSLEKSWTSQPIELPRITPLPKNNGRAINGHEIGLERVNAHKLWKMGYTGKGRISMNLDTGVWPEHPAIGDRFLGNFFPLSQTWFGLDFAMPMDKPGSHGTHTLGTAVGLDTANSDTIGLAFGAYWIASDVVATSLATVHPLSDFLLAYEWAMNPDGDTTTTWDVPDAINNSWGFVIPTDTNMCTSVVSQTLDALEAAGIANVFSAGNSGPGAGTVSYPQHISTGLVNSFTTGAVDGNNSNLPIANFSSRGPTICPRTGSLLIKPEVSAPGVNVRSGQGKTGYGTASGTSMAAPHVTGAVVLLKEAFPNVAGDEILLALYNSAVDLGDPGEDNTYGMGLIDVEAAFNLLSLTYTPSPPVGPGWDVAIVSIIEPKADFICDSIISPNIIFQNTGINTITSVSFSYALNGGNSQSQVWNGSLAPGQKDTLIISAFAIGNSGWNELFLKAQLGTLITESDTINNQRYFRFWRQASHKLPYSEGFEGIDLNNYEWLVENEDADISWDTISTGGISGSLHSVYLNFPDYLPKVRQRDELISPELQVPDTGNISLTFKVAYQHRHNVFSDSMEVWISTDCGQSWPARLYEKGGADLSTHDTVTQKFIPSRPSHWRTEFIDLSNYAGTGSIVLKWISVNNKGNYLILDDINLYAGAQVGLIEKVTDETFSVYPNPANSIVNLEFPTEWMGKPVSISAFQMNGKSMGEWNILAKNKWEFSLQNWSRGIYLIRICANGDCLSEKIMKY